jgi:hypothetical protein
MNDRHEEIRKLQERLRITTPKPIDLGKVPSGERINREFLNMFQTRKYTKPPEDKR